MDQHCGDARCYPENPKQQSFAGRKGTHISPWSWKVGPALPAWLGMPGQCSHGTCTVVCAQDPQWCYGYGVGMLLWYPSAWSDSCLLCSAEPKKSLHIGKREPGLSPEVGMGLL